MSISTNLLFKKQKLWLSYVIKRIFDRVYLAHLCKSSVFSGHIIHYIVKIRHVTKTFKQTQ